jgi:DNA recombination protein RmuC
MELNWLIGLVVGALLGGALVWLWLRSKPVTNPDVLGKLAKYDEAVREWSANMEQARLYKQELEKAAVREAEAHKRADEKDKQIANLRVEQAQRQQELLALQEKLALQKTELLDLQKQFKESFENLSTQILRRQTEEFRQASEHNLGQLLNPLKTNLEKFEKTVRDTYDSDLKDRASVKAQVEQLMGLNQQMAVEARNLTQALKGDSKVQGDWGETVLERLFESVGMQAGKHYLKQENLKSADGDNTRPDYIVRLPENRNVVIDCKVSLTAYERYAAATDDAQRSAALKAHIQSIRKHVDSLAEKRYQELQGLQAVDFVVLFMPIEPALNIALQSDERLHIDAIQKKILLASQTNLFAILRIILTMWRQQDVTKNAEEMARQAGAMYDKFVAFVDDLQEVGQRIKQTDAAYANALNKLHTGSGNLVRRAEGLRKLGLTTKKELPQALRTGNDGSDEPLALEEGPSA